MHLERSAAVYVEDYWLDAHRCIICWARRRVLIPQAKADYFDQRTVVTIDQPLKVPDAVLPPGTYIFKLFDSNAERKVVQVYDWNTNRLVASFIGFPIARLTPSRHTVLTFEPSSNAAQVLREWFYPGENYGLVFIYPR